MDFRINLPQLWDTPAYDPSSAAVWMCILYEEFWSSDPQHQSHIPKGTLLKFQVSSSPLLMDASLYIL